MDSPDLIFELEPQSSLAFALCHHGKNREFISGDAIGFSSDHGTRESSVSTVNGDADENDVPSHDTRLRFYFHKLPKDPGAGFVFGRDESCDVFLPFVSRRHFRIAFDGSGRLVLRSLAREMSVSYDGRGAGKLRHGFRWILFDWAEDIIVQPTARIKFRLHLGKNWRRYLAQYLSETDQHRADPTPTIYDSDLHGDQGPSETLRPSQRPFYHQLSELDRGAFATVYAVVDVSTGLEYAQKIFHSNMASDRLSAEVGILRSIKHNHIVRFVDFVNDECGTSLVMNLMKPGSLHFQHKDTAFTQEEAMMTLRQGLDGLQYLHERGIAHRDLKPKNILVSSREPLSICLSDFGLASNEYPLKTFCGSLEYCAPEVFSGQEYTPAVDIWSLGLVVLWILHDLPKTGRYYERTGSQNWFKALLRHMEKKSGQFAVEFLSEKMLQRNPKDRLSAKQCLLDPILKNISECNTPTEAMTQTTSDAGQDCRVLGENIFQRVTDECQLSQEHRLSQEGQRIFEEQHSPVPQHSLEQQNFPLPRSSQPTESLVHMLNDAPDWLQNLTTSQIAGPENIVATDGQSPEVTPTVNPDSVYQDIVISEKPLKKVLVDIARRKVNITHLLQAEGYTRAKRDAILHQREISCENRNGGRKTGDWIDVVKAIELCDDLCLSARQLCAVFGFNEACKTFGDEKFVAEGKTGHYQRLSFKYVQEPNSISLRNSDGRIDLARVLQIARFSSKESRRNFIEANNWNVDNVQDGRLRQGMWADVPTVLAACNAILPQLSCWPDRTRAIRRLMFLVQSNLAALPQEQAGYKVVKLSPEAPNGIRLRSHNGGFQANVTDILQLAGYSTHSQRLSFIVKHTVVYELDGGSQWVDQPTAIRVCEILSLTELVQHLKSQG